jgi:hypothetical protein
MKLIRYFSLLVIASGSTSMGGAAFDACAPGTTTAPSSCALPAARCGSPANDARFSPGQNITFDWSDVSGAASYTIQIDDHDSFPSPWLVNQTVTASTFSSTTLPTRTMWWLARGNDTSVNPGNWSSIRRVEVKD